MAVYGPDDCTFSWAGALVPDVTVIGELDKLVGMEETTPLGVAWETHSGTGVKKLSPVTAEAPYSDTAGSLSIVAETAGVGGTVAIIVTLGGSKTVSFSSIVVGHKRAVARGGLSKSIVTIQPTGTITEA